MIREASMNVTGTRLVYNASANEAKPIAVCGRMADLSNGRLICTFMIQSALGVNDFEPMSCYSDDAGKTWSLPKPMWPDRTQDESIFVSVSRRPDDRGNLIAFGVRWPIDTPGETFWRAENHSMKRNELIFALSDDGGSSWQAPQTIPTPTTGAAEAPGAICITQNGDWVASYSPCDSFAPTAQAPHQNLMFLHSADRGESWRSAASMTLSDEHDGTAESWVIELDDRRLVTGCWAKNRAQSIDYPNPFSFSSNSGLSWSPPCSVGIQGQSLALTPLTNGKFLVVYNQRRQKPAGVRLAIVQADESGFHLVADEIVWRAETTPTHVNVETDTSLSNWTSFEFGEPSVFSFSDNQAVVTLWCNQPGRAGILSVNVDISTLL